MSRDTFPIATLGKDLHKKCKEARVLMVGAGGIGCELLKNLVLGGFGYIHVVDLDTIDLSNLNRQFLFQKRHIKSSKANVAAETARAFNPTLKIISTHANIKDSQFDIEFFKSFDIILNALDNLEARRHVNLMSLYAEVPLIESGTTGYLGQVQVIVKGHTECYDCQEKPTTKTFPVCTIRSTPSAFIHCVVWAKNYLFGQLFGIDEDEAEDLDKEANADNAVEIENLKRESQALKKIKESMGKPEFAKMIFEKVFTKDIERLLSMEDMWKNRKPPVSLHLGDFEEPDILPTNGSSNTNGSTSSTGLKDQRMWSLLENVHMFLDSISRLSQVLLNDQKIDPTATLSFDKDDEDSLDFVTATANLRAHIFGIEQKTRFQVKEMAGNIIPAIATTNAIIAGMIVLEAYKVLSGHLEDCRMAYYSRRSDRLIIQEPLAKPNVYCPVCRMVFMQVKLDTKKITLKMFIDKIICGEKEGRSFGIDECSIYESGRLLYDPDFDDNVEKTLAEMGIFNGKILKVQDEEDSKVPIVFWVIDEENANMNLVGEIPKEIPSKPVMKVNQEAEELLKQDKAVIPSKRKAEDGKDLEQDSDGPGPRKKLKDREEVIDLEEKIQTDDGEKDLVVLD